MTGVTDHASSIQAVAMRVTKLNSAGIPLSATGSYWVSDQFIKVSFTPEYESGEEINQKAANGSLCAIFKTPDVLKRVTLAVDICNPEPELDALMNGGTVYTPSPGTGPATGYAGPLAGAITMPNGISIEVWTRAIVNGKPASVNPYWYWTFPYAQTNMTGEKVMENGLMGNSYAGYGTGNSVWAPGPDGRWPFTSDSPYQYARAATLPAITNTLNT